MTATWRFSSLLSFADHLENEARRARENAKRHKEKSIRGVEFRARAAELEAVVYMIHNMEITEEQT